MIKKRNLKNNTIQGCGEKGTLVHCWWECKLVQPLWKMVWKFLEKLKIELPYYLVISLLGMYLNKMKILIIKDKYTPIFIAALFTLANIWKHLSVHQQMNEDVVYIYIYIYTHTHNGILLSHKKE